MNKSIILLATLQVTAISASHAINTETSECPRIINVAPQGPRTAIQPLEDQPYSPEPDDLSLRIATLHGTPVSAVYNMQRLQNNILAGSDLLLCTPTLDIVQVDSAANKVTLGRGTHRMSIDFSNPDSVPAKLVALKRVPEGWRTESASFGFDVDYTDCDSASAWIMSPHDYIVTITYPADPELASKLFRIITRPPKTTPYDPADSTASCYTVYHVDTPVRTFDQYTAWYAENTFLNMHGDGIDSVRPAQPNRHKPFATGFSRATEIFPDYMAGNLITLCTTTASTYPAGGCFSTETVFDTYILDTGNPLTFDDIFIPGSMDRVTELYLDGVARSVNDMGYYVDYGDDYGDDEVPYGRTEVAEVLQQNDYDLTTCVTEHIGLCNDGVVFTYLLDSFSGFGEDGLVWFVVPYSAIGDCLREELRSITQPARP